MAIIVYVKFSKNYILKDIELCLDTLLLNNKGRKDSRFSLVAPELWIQSSCTT